MNENRGAEPVYVLKHDRQGRRGQQCKIVAYSRSLSGPVMVEFEDGVRIELARMSLRQATEMELKEKSDGEGRPGQ
jgi:hypothetical protein